MRKYNGCAVIGKLPLGFGISNRKQKEEVELVGLVSVLQALSHTHTNPPPHPPFPSHASIHSDKIQVLPHLLQQVVKVPFVVSGYGNGMGNAVDDVQLLHKQGEEKGDEEE